ncbi:two-component sensor histidine kinase [Pueribacillus theae]|uniref:histidine kinase n=1 Tax=Pueribacillus theae TaxID=2171751 RepID=A0A2U1K4R8_9BACI|nr:HAMP domain-containing sensor histidine kinase [Pueribacillus theae]PWA12511.1 two-component sensor histidine kinase [Pueribacillus theae]
MNLNRIVLKWGGSILLLFLIVLIPTGFILHTIYSGLYYNDKEEEINDLSSRYANAMKSVQDRDILQMFVTLSGFTNNEVYIVDKDGMIVADSGIAGIVAGEKIKANELATLKKGEAVDKEYHFLPSTERFLVSGKPIFNEDSFEGGMFVMSSLDAIDQSLTQVKLLVILSGIVAFMIASGFIFVLSRKLSAPLLEMEKATRKISRGHLQTRVNISSDDEIGHLAAAINDLAVELERYRSNRQEFFATISHELRTPITYLEGYANVLKNELYETEEEKKKYLSIISDETKRLVRLINDLFELAKAEEEQLTLEKELVDVRKIIDGVIVKVSLKAEEKGLNIEKNLTKHTQLVQGDQQRMEQIFINLLENAIQYTESGKIKVDLHEISSNQVKVTISDTGMGIPDEEIPFIFERFHRVEKSRSRDFGGTGLGLSIVKKLVEMQNGTIHVKSTLGKGTTFEVIFPTADKTSLS